MIKDKSNYFYRKMPNENFFVDIIRRDLNKSEIIFDTHWHEHIQFFYFTAGQALVRCNSKQIIAGVDDLIVVNSNELHYSQSLSDNLTCYIIRVDFSFLYSNQVDSCQTKFLAPLSNNLILFENLIHNNQNVIICMKNIIKEYFTQELGYELAIKSSLYHLIVILLRNYVNKILTQKEYDYQINRFKKMNNIFKYINENFNKKITVSGLAEQANVTSYHFCRLFKLSTGKSPVEYINSLRINKAISLLQESELNITEIAYECGFEDSNYFSRIFKKYKNISPTQMRNSNVQKAP